MVEAMAIAEGKIIALGSNSAIDGYRRPSTQVIDLQGKTVLPGFIDAHQHQLYMGLSFHQVDATSDSVSSIGDIVEKLRQQATTTKSGRWIEGRGYHDARLAENRNPNRYDLDQATTDHPIFLTRMCGHIMALNSRALDLAGITSDTPDPPGGHIERDSDTGEPTGVLHETAMRLLRRAVPPPSSQALKDAILEGASHNLSKGITTVWEPSIEPDHLEAYRKLVAEGNLPIRVTMAHKKILRSGEEVPLPSRFTGDWLSLVAVKLFQDGGFGGATAALTSPYTNDPDTSGLLVMEQEELNQRVRDIHHAGLRVSVHAIGDAAIISVLHAVEEALAEKPMHNHRHRIEHCGLPIPPLPARIKQLEMIPVVQPPFLWFDGDVYMDRVGEGRANWLYPIKTLLDVGLTVAGSSDGPVVPDVSPLLGIYTAVTRQSRNGRIVAEAEGISVKEAIELYTVNAAYACGEEHIKGSFATGMLADCVVLEDDPMKVDIESLPDLPIHQVIVNGKPEPA